MQVAVGQLRRWRPHRPAPESTMFIVLSERKEFVGDDGCTYAVKELAWNCLEGGREEWNWDENIVVGSVVVSEAG